MLAIVLSLSKDNGSTMLAIVLSLSKDKQSESNYENSGYWFRRQGARDSLEA